MKRNFSTILPAVMMSATGTRFYLPITFMVIGVLLTSTIDVCAQEETNAEVQMKLRKASGLFGERGYSEGTPLNVDGKLSISSSNGNVMYTYPISSRTINGMPMDVSLNYCGSVGFSAFTNVNRIPADSNYHTDIPWNKFSVNRPAWMLSVNGFAVQVLGFNTVFHVFPDMFMYPDSNNLNFDRTVNWSVDGYDFSNSMKRFDWMSNGYNDEIHLMRGDGSVLELRNRAERGFTDDPSPYGITDINKRSDYVTGYYYESGVNTHGYAIVEFDSTRLHWQPYYTKYLPFSIDSSVYNNITHGYDIVQYLGFYFPRVVRYFPGDGLEYVFHEWLAPFGMQSVTDNEYVTGAGYSTTTYPAIKSGYHWMPTIFYLEEIKYGNTTLTRFHRSRHFPRFDPNQVHYDSTKGRAPLTGFDGHTLEYGTNTLTIQALGRTIKIQYDSVLKEGYGFSFSENQGIPWGEYGDLKRAENIAASAMRYPGQYKSYYGYVTSITDPENRITTFEYEPLTKTYKGFKFPVDNAPPNSLENSIMKVPIFRLKEVAEPAALYTLEYYQAADSNFHLVDYNSLNGQGSYSHGGLSYKMNNVAHTMYKRRVEDNALLLTSEYAFNLGNGASFGDPNYYPNFSLGSEIVATDNVDNTYSSTLTTFKRFEITPTPRGVGCCEPLTYVYSPTIIQSINGESIITETEEVDSVAGNSLYYYAPKWKSVKYAKVGGDTLLKSYQTFKYNYAKVRTYGGDDDLADKLGWERIEDTVFTYRPDSTTAAPLFYNVNRYKHFPLATETLTYIDSIWQKHASIQEYLRLRDENDPDVVGRSWEEVMCLGKIAKFTYDTLENTPIEFAPTYNLPTFSGIFSREGSLLGGSAHGYYDDASIDGKPTFARGKLQYDTVITRGSSAQFRSGTYSYGGNFYAGGLLYDITNSSGGTAHKRYDYNLPFLTFVPQGQTCSEYKLPTGYLKLNNDGIDSVEMKGGYHSFSSEKPLAEQATIRKYVLDSTGTPELKTSALTTFYERTYYGLVSATIDPNGWYSQFDYDRNGRIKHAWMPFDFYRPGSTYEDPLRQGELSIPSNGTIDEYIVVDSLYCWKDTAGVAHRVMVNSVDTFHFENQGNGELYASLQQAAYSRCPCEVPDSTDGGGSGSALVDNSNINTVSKKNKGEKLLYIDDGTYWWCKYEGLTDRQYRHVAVTDFDLSPLALDSTSIDSIKAEFFITSVVGSDVILKVHLPQLGDTTMTFYFDQSGDSNTIGATGNYTLSIPLSDFEAEILSLADGEQPLHIEAEVTTVNTAIHFANDAEDTRPRVRAWGLVRSTFDLADYTLEYVYRDWEQRAAVNAKIDDQLHSANNAGLFASEYSRYGQVWNYFTYDNLVKESHTFRATDTYDSVRMWYNGNGRPTGAQDELGYFTYIKNDGLGRVVRTLTHDSAKVETAYMFGHPATFGITGQDFFGFCSAVTTTDEQNIKITRYSDAFDRLRREVVDSASITGGLVTTYDYDILGRLRKVVNPAGQKTHYWYDDFGRVRYKQHPDIGLQSFGYDILGNVRFSQTQKQWENNRLSFRQYDDLNRPTIIGEADFGGDEPEPIEAEFDNEELNLYRFTDVLDPDALHTGAETTISTANKTLWLDSDTHERDTAATRFSACLPPAVAFPDGWHSGLSSFLVRPFAYAHGTFSVPCDTSDFEHIAEHPENVRVSIVYDTLPYRAGAIWAGCPAQSRWNQLTPNGAFRNLRGRQAAIAWRDSSAEGWHFAMYDYDERGRLAAEVRYTTALGFDAVYYRYNSMNQPIAVTAADAWHSRTTWYGYDWSGRMDTVWTRTTDAGLGASDTARYAALTARPDTAVAAYQYDKRSQVTNLHLIEPQTDIGYHYGIRRWLDTMTATQNSGADTVFAMALTYRNDGQITKQTYQHLGDEPRLQNYTYDNYRRLTGWSSEGATTYEQYIYDSVGNRKSHTRNFSPTAYSYLSGTNQLTAVTGAMLADTLSYDADGALTARKRERSMGNNNYLGVDNETFGYNYAGVVRRYERSQNYKTLGSCAEPTEETPVIWKYRYSAGAERELKWLQSADLIPDIAKNWVYYQLGADKRQHGVYNGRETSAYDACSSFVARVHWFPTEYLTYGLGGTPLVSYKPFVADGETYYIADHLGNTRVTLSSNGNVVTAKDFEPFGKELHSNGSDRLTFIGKENDAESDLGDFGVRKYEAEYGRFLSVDPLWEKYISFNSYHYCKNNPIIAADRSGDSMVVLVDKQGAAGMGTPMGHAAILIGNDNDGWHLFSKNGAEGGGVYGDSWEPQDWVYYKSLEEFKKNTEEEYFQGRYDEAFLIPSNSEQDKKAKEAASKIVEETYNVLASSCNTVIVEAVKAAGKSTGKVQLTTVTTPNGIPIPINLMPNIKMADIKKDNKAKDVTNEVLSSKRKDKKN